ncbi:MAG: hypothetical protein ACI8WB_001702 [Phenylobacterium sp.]
MTDTTVLFSVAGPTTAAQLSAVNGYFDLTLNVPRVVSGVETGQVPLSININAYPWLQFDWGGDGVDDIILPEATATYGQLRGNDRVIYWREKR